MTPPNHVGSPSATLQSPPLFSDLDSFATRNDMLLDLYLSYQSNQNEPMNIHHKNGSITKMIFVPVCTTANSFRNKGEKVIDEVIKHMSNEETSETYHSEMTSACHVMKYMASKFPQSYDSITEVTERKMRLDPFETSALIEYCDLTEDTAYEKLNRFILNIRGINILAPKRDLPGFLDDIPPTKNYSTSVDCNTKNVKKTQTADCVETTMHDSIKHKIQRYLCDDSELYGVSQPVSSTIPMFGYDNPDDINTVLGVIGTDHGQKHSQFLLSLHLHPSTKRRDKKDKAFGILQIPFCTIKCKKENSDILQLSAPSVNKSIKILENSKLMAVRCDKSVHCFWVNKNARNIRIERDSPDCRRIRYDCDGNVYTQCMPIEFQNDDAKLQIFTVMSPLHFIVVCDISAMFTLMGRDGNSPSKCLKCDLKISEWKKDKTKKGSDLTMDLLATMLLTMRDKEINRAGVKAKPLFDLPPSRYLCPLLHLLLGLINDVMGKGVIPFALRMDGCTDKELEIRMRLLDDDCSRREIVTLKAQLKKMITARTSTQNGTDSEIRNKLTESGIYFENYHGGTLNGNNCQAMCAKAREVMEVCKKICRGRLETHMKNGTLPMYSPTIEDCDEKFETLAQVLEIADVVFAGCNIVAPNEEEIRQLEKNIEILENRWRKANLPVTPKAHLTFQHLIGDVRLYGGLADKQEQELERRHQFQKKWSNRLRNMRNITDGLRKQYQYEWRMTHPRVERLICEVTKPCRKRKGSPTLTIKEENDIQRADVKRERREEVVRRLRMEVEDDEDED